MKFGIPNPFHRSRQSHCEISFTCEKGMSVITCSIFDLQGRCVRILSDESLQAGAGKFLWDGKNNNGRDLPVGVYVLYLEANPRQGKSGFHKQKTIVLGK
jgi:flagellar hook assembly protein FlgD